MKTHRLLIVFAAVMVILSLVAGCAAPPATTDLSAPAADSDAAAKPYIPVISKGFQHQFWQAVKVGSEQAAADFNVDITFEGPESEAQVDKQIEMLQAALAKNPAAICLAALDSKAVIPLLEEAKAKGIPDRRLRLRRRQRHPGRHGRNRQHCCRCHGCRQDGRADRRRRQGGRSGPRPDQPHRHRPPRRFRESDGRKYPDIEIVNVDYGDGNQLKSTDLAKAVMQANPDLKGYFGANEGSIIGVLNAVNELGKEGEIVVIGYDSGKQQMDAIRAVLRPARSPRTRSASATSASKPPSKPSTAKTLDKVIDTGFFWYDASNIDSDEIKPLLYE